MWTLLLNQETWVKSSCCYPIIKTLWVEFSLANDYYAVKLASNFTFAICIRGHVTVLVLKPTASISFSATLRASISYFVK